MTECYRCYFTNNICDILGRAACSSNYIISCDKSIHILLMTKLSDSSIWILRSHETQTEKYAPGSKAWMQLLRLVSVSLCLISRMKVNHFVTCRGRVYTHPHSLAHLTLKITEGKTDIILTRGRCMKAHP